MAVSYRFRVEIFFKVLVPCLISNSHMLKRSSSGTTPYDHPWPNAESFSLFENPVHRGFYVLGVVTVTGFHCSTQGKDIRFGHTRGLHDRNCTGAQCTRKVPGVTNFNCSF